METGLRAPSTHQKKIEHFSSCFFTLSVVEGHHFFALAADLKVTCCKLSSDHKFKIFMELKCPELAVLQSYEVISL